MRDKKFFMDIANGNDRKFRQHWITQNLASDGVCMALAIAFIARQARKREQRGDVLFYPGISAAAQALARGLLEDLDREHFTAAVDAKKKKPKVGQGNNERHTRIGRLQTAFAGDIKERTKHKPLAQAQLDSVVMQVKNLTGLTCVERADNASPVKGANAFWYISEVNPPHGWSITADSVWERYKLFDPNRGRIVFDTAEQLVEAANKYHEDGARFLRFEYTPVQPE